jgi:hypothetical protein
MYPHTRAHTHTHTHTHTHLHLHTHTHTQMGRRRPRAGAGRNGGGVHALHLRRARHERGAGGRRGRWGGREGVAFYTTVCKDESYPDSAVHHTRARTHTITHTHARTRTHTYTHTSRFACFLFFASHSPLPPSPFYPPERTHTHTHTGLLHREGPRIPLGRCAAGRGGRLLVGGGMCGWVGGWVGDLLVGVGGWVGGWVRED